MQPTQSVSPELFEKLVPEMVNNSLRDVRIYEADVLKTLRMVNEGATGSDLVDAGIRKSNGDVISGRQSRRIRAEVELFLDSLDTVPLAEEHIELPDPIHLRSAVFDIEVTDFDAVGFKGYFICGVITPTDTREPEVYKIKYEDFQEDRRVLQEFLTALAKYDILIGHNIASFDINWLHSRALVHDLDWPRSWHYFDTYQVAKSMALKGRKGLAALCDMFEIPCIKTSIQTRSWHDVRSPKRERFDRALKEIEFHCVEDVKANMHLYDKLYPPAMRMRANQLKLTKW